MTEDAKLKQVINKVNNAIEWIYSLGCIVPNSLNTELDSDEDDLYLYLQTPNNLIIPSMFLNDQTYDYLLEQDDASNGEGIIVSLAGSFFDATAPERRAELDSTQLRQDVDYLYNVWYRLTRKNETINNYYRDTAGTSIVEIRENLQKALTASGLKSATVRSAR